MNNDLIIQCIITVIGWIVVYILAIRQNTQIKKKEVTIEYLIQAWGKLEKASNRKDNRYNTEIETAIADIQLFGTKQQIELAQQFAEEIARNKESSALELLILLRENLRKELKLEKAPRKFKFLRFSK
ncbi:hypothetical protein SJDPG2_09395 [Porphyromonas gingivalis SJD2]|uniref:hypothetical protein n=1 Tax=Porphyromonas gingivalis TaxID=837 RepID=UPI0003D1B930|nr:hypothetical protein [Porphyromonas gingivalis]ETA26006.1 hypothetical protein SJDPG2_09395 [Porphyromonas gingivalis SJD2]OWR76255.1 hypothetical protein SJDPG5_08085 [Porphyromonas gingivalis SJD5]PDP55470.1 hypothetical protein CLI74_09450 [Porphyromonas gingivalis]